MKSNKSAAARTLDMPGVDVREQLDRNELDLRGTPLRKLVLQTYPLSTHLATCHKPHKALCGAEGTPSDAAPGKGVCGACRVAAADKALGPLGGSVWP